VTVVEKHRVALPGGALALVLHLPDAPARVPGVVLEDPGCVAKTYPNYWRDWQRARAVPRR